MAIYKPSWLRNLLDKLNWDIFTWKVYVGDAIERGIDWALAWIDWGIEQAAAAYSYADSAFREAVDTFRILSARLNTEVSRIYDKISTWWGDLGEWWSTKVTWIRDLVAAAEDFWAARIRDVTRTLQGLDAAWDNFRRYTLPSLLDTSWIRAFFGRGIASISEWWASRRQEINERIDTEVTPVRDEVNKHTSWLDLVKELFTDPEKFLYDLAIRMIERFW